MKMQYSVLMSVYIKEKPEFLKQAMESIRMQTVPTNDFVLVCDGPLTDDLNNVILEEKIKFRDNLKVIRLEKNSGLGNALNIGLKECKHELIARMDSDDLSRANRCEKQLAIFSQNPEIAFTSGIVNEFVNDPYVSTGKRVLPLTNDDIIKFSRKRNPINHPCVMFKKTAVEDSGGYKETFHLFEDYYLWVRMLMKGYKGMNLNDVLLDMRTSSEMYTRRGGMNYAKELLRFHKWLKKIGWINEFDYLLSVIPHAVLCIFPNGLRKIIYKRLHS